MIDQPRSGCPLFSSRLILRESPIRQICPSGMCPCTLVPGELASITKQA